VSSALNYVNYAFFAFLIFFFVYTYYGVYFVYDNYNNNNYKCAMLLDLQNWPHAAVCHVLFTNLAQKNLTMNVWRYFCQIY